MRVVRIVLGIVLFLIGLLWIGQGVGIIAGSMMSGQAIYALLGLLCVVVGVWLLSSTMLPRSGRLRR
jgi:hypothetical protein